MKRIGILGCVVFALTVDVFAQEQPRVTDGATVSPEQAEKLKNAQEPKLDAVSEQDQQTYVLLLYRASVQRSDIAALQKELDSTNAEVQRLIDRLQKPGFELARDPQTGRLHYAKKPEPKKELEKK